MTQNRLKYNVASTKFDCLDSLAEANLTSVILDDEDDIWCPATWDTFLCWPPAQANSTAFLQCPKIPGLLHRENATKFCDEMGRWGDTNLRNCFDLSTLDIALDDTTLSPIESPATVAVNFTAENTTTDAELATKISTVYASGTVGVIEYVGLALSILDILIILFVILCTVRRNWRLNQVRVGLLSALLIMCIIWLSVRIDKHLKDSTGSYNGIIFVNQPVCETFSGLLEWSKVFVASWLACVCFHGFLENVKPLIARRFLNLVFYILFTVVYSALVVSIWVTLVKYAEEPGSEHICDNRYDSRPLFHVVIWPCFVLILAATVLAFIHTVVSLRNLCARQEYPNANRRRFIQGIIHFIICLYASAFWYFNYMNALNELDFGMETTTLLSTVATYIVYFFGAFVAIWIGVSQCCLPAKEVTQ